MNVFTALRYPVDIRFLTSDLERIPSDVLQAWWAYGQRHLFAAHNRARIPCIPHRIHIYLNNSTRKSVRKQMLDKLKEYITQYDDLRHNQIPG